MLEWMHAYPITTAIVVYVCCAIWMLLMALSICRGGSFYDED